MNRLLIFLLALTLLTTVGLSAQTSGSKTGIEFFEGSWDEVQAAAKAEGKHIFVDVYTTWCGPCKKMSSLTFKDADVADFYNQYFINYKVDAERGEGPAFAGKYGVRAYPTLLYFDEDAAKVKEIKGFRAPDAFLEEAKALFQNDELLAELRERFDSGDLEAGFMRELVELQNMMGENNPDVENAFLQTLTDEDLRRPENADLVFAAADRIDTRFYDLLVSKRSLFEEIKGKEAVNNKIRNASVAGIQLAVAEKSDAIYKKSVAGIESVEVPQKDILLFNMGLEYYKGLDDWKTYAKYATNYLSKNDISSANTLNNVAWAFYEHIDKKKQLELAEDWARRSVAMQSDHYNNDTLAALLYKLGKYDEAAQTAEKAIAIAKYKRADASGTKKLLEQINQKRFN